MTQKAGHLGWLARKAASGWSPAQRIGTEWIPCRAFSQSATIHLSKNEHEWEKSNVGAKDCVATV